MLTAKQSLCLAVRLDIHLDLILVSILYVHSYVHTQWYATIHKHSLGRPQQF